MVDGDPHRVQIMMPDDFEMPEGGLNIPIYEDPYMGEDRMHDYKRFAAQAFARANNLDKRTLGQPGARVGILSSGKSWLDVVHALELLGIDEAAAQQMGLTVYKVGLVWPLEPGSNGRDDDRVPVVKRRMPLNVGALFVRNLARAGCESFLVHTPGYSVAMLAESVHSVAGRRNGSNLAH